LGTAARDLSTGETAAAARARESRLVSQMPDPAGEVSAPSEGTEAHSRRRARRLAFLLMMASGASVLAVLGGIWLLVRHSL
jgi:hypothetical protein